jgi:DNA polymerase-3 subunit epsilon
MTWFTNLFARPPLSESQVACLKAWQVLPNPDLASPFNAARYVVVDVETSGLNLVKDKLISIGAVAVVHGKIDLADSFYVVLQQAHASDKDNILLHGITGSAQTEGVPAAQALLEFLAYLGKAPLIAFHVTFDQTMIKRAMRDHLGLNFKHKWSDVAYIAPALYPTLSSKLNSLDDWIDHFGIRNDARHNAMADALVTAQLLQVLLHQSRTKKISSLAQLNQLESMQRWVRARV